MIFGRWSTISIVQMLLLPSNKIILVGPDEDHDSGRGIPLAHHLVDLVFHDSTSAESLAPSIADFSAWRTPVSLVLDET